MLVAEGISQLFTNWNTIAFQCDQIEDFQFDQFDATEKTRLYFNWCRGVRIDS